MDRLMVVVLVICVGGCGKDNPVAEKPPAGVTVTCPEGTKQTGAKRGLWCVDQAGKKQGPLIRWNEHGVVTQRGAYRDDKMQGAWEHYHPDGKKASIAVYRDGREHGHFKWWYPTGIKSSESHYVNGRYHGTHTNYDAQGRPTEVNEYVHGNRVKADKYADGKKVSSQTFELWVPDGEAATTSHPEIPAAWQTCQDNHDCVLQVARCCACGAGDSVAVNLRFSDQAQRKLRSLRDCNGRRCPSQMCQRVGARCDNGRCVTAE